MFWLNFLLGFLIAVIFYILIFKFIWLYQVYRIYDKENHCNYCKSSVLELDAKYCPRCGRRLTLHEENPLFNSREEGVERENQLEYYDDGQISGYFDENGHLVVCEEYGTDEELGRYSVEVQNGDGYYDSTGKFRRYKD